MKLVGMIICQFEMSYNEKVKMKQNVSWLIRFGFEDCVCEVYFVVCSDIVYKRFWYV